LMSMTGSRICIALRVRSAAFDTLVSRPAI
jgi:hypothetical protein